MINIGNVVVRFPLKILQSILASYRLQEAPKKSFTFKKKYGFPNVQYLWEMISSPHTDTSFLRCPSPLYKMAQCLHITYTYTPLYSETSLDCL
jgi:hypothetical protein